MFALNERVIYGSVGVCEISDIVENELTGVLREYYVLKPVDTDKSVIYVPTDNEKLISRMREVPCAKELKKILTDIKGEQLSWIENNLERSEFFHSIINDGEIKQVALLFVTLHKHQNELSLRGKRLQKTDERIYKDCSKLLCSEFSSILKLEHNEVLSLILDSVE
ncbi:MAG: hypothetical protein IJ015_04125 [Ruminococcus sp.]|nr:hypothetical protein [Ruminococcus sp.]